MNIPDLLKKQAEQYPQKPAIIFKDEDITFSNLRTHVLRWAQALDKLGVVHGEKVAIYLPNCPEYIYGYLAIFSLGAVVVPLDFMLTEREIVNFIQHSDAATLIVKDKKGIDLRQVKRECPTLKRVIFLGGMEGPATPEEGFYPLEQQMAEDANFVLPAGIEDKDEAAIFYTSGSTGHPKGVLLTYAHLDNPVRCITHFLKPSDQDSYLCAGVPFSHIGGLDYMLFMLAFASTLVLMERFQPLEALRNIERHKATIFCIVPSMFVAIVSLKDSEKFDLSSLHYAAVFGAPSSPILLKRFHALCPNAVLVNGWGMTETAAPNTYSPPDVSKLHSIGPFGAGMEARIVDDAGAEVPSGEKGELWVKGPGVMVGYYKEDAMTREVLTEDGWLKTGDIARRDADGLFYLVGRKKDMIKVAGEIVFSPEVEEVIHRHPKVKEVAVIGLPDPLRGEVPKAFIVPKEGATVDLEDIRSFCRERLAHFKLPHHIEMQGALPKNRMGKIDKEALKKGAGVS